ncbi:hypothetical protein HPB49_004455 [Dermacentor silvarum]|uniref:Uncharacterized protein n=1 Tax=Dermacentor silvarum TaxID=543639 RepID=A0ACB8C7C6_DERSI|nr:hypothetical protein HPB49_004455 [Dermacentor silvarum]
MPRNCCVPRCTSNAKKNPGIRYHEFPSDAGRRSQWLHNISRQGSSGKASKWEPNDSSLVCSLHFKEDDYRKTTKYRVLLPTAVPSVFPNYPAYMRRDNTQRSRKNPRKCVSLSLPDEQSDVVTSDSRDCCAINQSEGEIPGCVIELATETARENSDQNTLLLDGASQTDLDIDGMMEKSKKTIHRLEMKLSRLKKVLQTLQDGYDEARVRLRAYGESKESQQFLTVLTAAEQGEKAALFIQNQVVNFHAQNPAYSEAILRECVLWKACSNKGYSHVRSLFKLPCRTTLQKYVGK